MLRSVIFLFLFLLGNSYGQKLINTGNIQTTNGFGTSLPCELNANNNEFASFRSTNSAVFKISGWATGYLINSLSGNNRHLAITKHHAFPSDVKVGDQTVLTMIFNYQFPDSDTQQQEPAGITLTTQVKLLVRDLLADRVLFEIMAPAQGFPPNLLFNPLGWDLSNNLNLNDNLVTFGHPMEDVKKGSVVRITSKSSQYISGDVIQGAIECGNSGNPLIDNSGRVRGDLRSGSLYGCGSSPEAQIKYTNISYNWASFKSYLDPDNTGAITCNAPLSSLPVELTSFSYRMKEGNVELLWETATELKNYGFDIEKKTEDGKEWTQVGFVPGHGNSNIVQHYSFKEHPAAITKCLYRLKQIDQDGLSTYSNPLEVTIESPGDFVLAQNYPNPFNPSTKIEYQLPVDARVKIELFSITGQIVSELVNTDQSAGVYTIDLGPNTFKGNASGVYIYRMIATGKGSGKDFVSSKKLMLMK
jgi:hypothetical protein